MALCNLEEWLMRNEHSEVEMRCRLQQGANAWGKVEGVMLDRNIFEKAEKESPESLCYTSMP